jgi:hypothetical protein
MSDLKKFIADKLLSLFIDYFAKEAWSTYTRERRRNLHSELKNKIKSEIDADLLKRYGDRKIYDKISRILIIDNKIDLIFERCYLRHKSDYTKDDEFIAMIIDDSNMKYTDYEDMVIILRSIINTVFKVLNDPQNDSERKIINVITSTINPLKREISDLRELISNTQSVSNLVTQKQEVIVDWDKMDIESKIVLFDNEKYFVSIRNKKSDSNFKVKFFVEYTGTIQKCGGLKEYFNEIQLLDDEKTVNVHKVELWEDDKILFSKNYASQNSVAIEFAIYETRTLDLEIVEKLKNLENPSIKIIPQKKYVTFDIETKNYEILFANLKFEIMKSNIDENKIKWKFISANNDICSSIVIEWNISKHDSRLSSSNINLSIQNGTIARNRLQHYIYLDKIVSGSEFIIRDSESKSIVSRGSNIMFENKFNYLDHIDFFKKVISVQDYFHINFSLPMSITSDDEELISIVHDMITHGYAKVTESPYDVEIEPIDYEKLSNVDSYKNKITYKGNVESIDIFDVRIEMKNLAEKIVLNASLENISGNVYRLSTDNPAVVIYKPLFGDIDTIQKVENIISHI